MKIADTSFLAQFSSAEPAAKITTKKYNTTMFLIKSFKKYIQVIIRTVFFFCIKKANGSYIKLSAILNEKCNTK